MYSPLLQLFTFHTSSSGRLLRSGPLLLVFALSLLVFSPTAEAVSPSPDGGYPGGNTAEGDGALNSLNPPSRGQSRGNTALGFQTLFSVTNGSLNTATGINALRNN